MGACRLVLGGRLNCTGYLRLPLLVAAIAFAFGLMGNTSCTDSSGGANSANGGKRKQDTEQGHEMSATSDCEVNPPITLADPSVVTTLPNRTDKFCAIMLAIMPEYLGWIETGAKSFEFRKAHPSDPISHIVFYKNQADELYGIAEVVQSFGGDPKLVVDQTWRFSGTTEAGLMSYFGALPVGFAIEIRNFQAFKNPIPLDEAKKIDPTFRKPSGYVFLERYPKLNNEIEKLIAPATATPSP